MTLLLTLLATTSEEHHPILMPPLAFAGVAFAVFLVLGVTTWSFRDVANRHSQKFGNSSSDHHTGH
ncbi:hypothetical protein B0I08_101272 [Glaciihabitans tibetensis]|uniref:Uncharacterized protein n=1 Tax=Glaciihabitans tibetensis TaxID=1266600 RepID=A0A2T0VJ64_9MICO|nr:hypothetical protein [Glaciihabitans tibetensis]PRY70145.1 hypothetical protein B0I08_101272 [Glaciihabitans tibetensis]